MNIIALALALVTSTAHFPSTPADVKAAVAKGLKWLADQQKPDGSWVSENGTYPTFTTASVGIALLMEGSTLKHGTYAPHLRKALAWMEKNVAEDGGFGGKEPNDTGISAVGHGGALLFLVCAYEADDDEPRRKRVAKLIDRAIVYAARCQSDSGGWGWTPTPDERGLDSSYPTMVVLQALVAARKTGFTVPVKSAERGVACLVKATHRTGKVRYNSQLAETDGDNGTEPLYTAGAALGMIMSEKPQRDVLARWVRYAKGAAPGAGKNFAADTVPLYAQSFTGRLAYSLGEDGHRRLDPTAKAADLMRWSAYKATVFPALLAARQPDGGWPGVFYGRQLTTALVLTVLQLDNDYLPAFSR